MSRHSRAAARDYWNRPAVVQMCRRLDTLGAWTAGTLLAVGLMFAGSLNIPF